MKYSLTGMSWVQSFVKNRTLIAKSQVFTSVPWRASEPVTQSHEGEHDFMSE